MSASLVTAALAVVWLGLYGVLIARDPRLVVVAASSLIFSLCRMWLAPLVSSRVLAFQTFSTTKQNLWSNTFVSMLHAMASATVAILALATNHSMHGDFVNTTSPLEFAAVAISTGYFAYDLGDYVMHRLYIKAPAIIVHHVVILTCHSAALVKNVGVPLLSFALLCEVHSTTLHLRKMLSMSQYSMSSSPLYRFVWAMQWVSIVCARLVPHLLVLWLVVWYRSLFQNQVYFLTAFIGILFVNVLNFQLTADNWRVYSTERQEWKRVKSV